MVTGKEIHTQRNRFFMAFLEKSRKECVKMGLAHEKKSYLQEKANLFEIGSHHNIKKQIIFLTSGKNALL